ncbi:MAG: hypothetical protein NVS2B14_10510 [Chamaesiphon sp.]
MPDMSSDEELDVAIGETTSDIEVSLPANNLHITISRIDRGDGTWVTKIWFSRKTRRFYAMGLLTEALAIMQSANSEVTWSNETPGCMPDEEC